MNEKIEKFFNQLPSKKHDLALKIRSTVIGVDKKISEDIKWGNLTFIHKGKMASIYTYTTTDYLNFCFFKAAKLKDPKGLFEGTGKGMRHVKIKSEKDIDVAQIRSWVKEAMKLNE